LIPRPGLTYDAAMSSEPQASLSLRDRLESGRLSATSPDASILDAVARLKEQILEKEETLRARTGDLVATVDYLRGVFGALRDAVLVIDPRGLVEFANQAALELIGLPQERLLGQPAASLWVELDQAALFEGQGLAEVLRLGAFQRTNMSLKTTRGPVPVSWSASVLRHGEQVAGLVGIAHDVRVERRLEEEKLRAVRAMAAGVAHEIRNPLGAIQSSVALLLRDLILEGDDADLLRIVFDETQRITEIVARFLEFARPQAPALTPGEVGPLLRGLLTLAEKDPRAAELRLMLHADPELPVVLFDPALLKQVLWNLLDNALAAATSRIAVRARRAPSGGVELRVADDGPGMEPSLLARACQPFHTTKAQGTGLGLAICKQIVSDHGGVLRLDSLRGAGTTVSFTLAPTRTA
jgi:two-component system nitrogen regulation sensor histidine kinase GlnL